MKYITAGVLALVLLVPSFSHAAAATVTNTAEAWSVRPPSGWTKEVNNSGIYKMTTFFSETRNASFRVMTTTIKFGSTDKKNLSGYVQVKKDSLKNQLSQYEEVSDEKTKLSKEPARLVEFTWVAGQLDRSQALMASYNGRIYEIAMTASDSTWNAASDLMDEALSTFKFLKPVSLKKMKWGQDKFLLFAEGSGLDGFTFVGTDNDFIDGGSGTDTVLYSGPRNQYILYYGKEFPKDGYKKTVIVYDTHDLSVDVLVNNEVLAFSDQTLSLPSLKIKH